MEPTELPQGHERNPGTTCSRSLRNLRGETSSKLVRPRPILAADRQRFLRPWSPVTTIVSRPTLFRKKSTSRAMTSSALSLGPANTTATNPHPSPTRWAVGNDPWSTTSTALPLNPRSLAQIWKTSTSRACGMSKSARPLTFSTSIRTNAPRRPASISRRSGSVCVSESSAFPSIHWSDFCEVCDGRKHRDGTTDELRHNSSSDTIVC
mmetsp:Transcript_51576/g.154835  ORF Transcript_51576/g.154835 Transcript_51576/m.154835 type:complete len:208 (+) Transcript_51576:579-1202(+)